MQLNILQEFIKTHKNDWLDEIQKPPYCIKVKRDGQFVLLKYDQLNSDFSEPLVQLCRGIILQEYVGNYHIVCYPFEKFFNYGEPNAAHLDYNNGLVIREKIDGSFIKIWADLENNWHISTNGTIDAYKTKVNDEGVTFGDLVDEAIGIENMDYFLDTLNPDITYMFELVSPQSAMTIYYQDTVLYYLGEREMMHYSEQFTFDPDWLEFGIRCPMQYYLSFDEAIDMVNQMSIDKEGVVISDKNYNRIKIKSPAYLIAAHCADSGTKIPSIKKCLWLIMNKKDDDFIAVAPRWAGKINKYKRALSLAKQALDEDFDAIKHRFWMPKKDFYNFAKMVLGNNESLYYIMERYTNREMQDCEQFISNMTPPRLVNYVKKFLEASE